MPELRIVFPSEDFKAPYDRPLIATGRADESIIGVRGECQPDAADGHVIKGATFFHVLMGAKDNVRSYRWVICFPFKRDELGTYRLKVTGFEEGGGTYEESLNIEVVAAQPARGAAVATAKDPVPEDGRSPFEVRISDLNNGDPIPDPDNFNPGGFANLPLTSVTLIEQDTYVSVGNYYSYDPTTQSWVALFEHVPTGTNYTLTVTDSQPSTDQRTGLHQP